MYKIARFTGKFVFKKYAPTKKIAYTDSSPRFELRSNFPNYTDASTLNSQP